jgi:hypothetical protein
MAVIIPSNFISYLGLIICVIPLKYQFRVSMCPVLFGKGDMIIYRDRANVLDFGANAGIEDR